MLNVGEDAKKKRKRERETGSACVRDINIPPFTIYAAFTFPENRIGYSIHSSLFNEIQSIFIKA